MKKILGLTMVSLLSISLFSCANSNNKEENVFKLLGQPDIAYNRNINDDHYSTFIDKYEAFSSKLTYSYAKEFKNIQGYQNLNLTHSPLSIFSSLCVVAKISNGECKNEILNALDMDIDLIDECIGNFLYSHDNEVEEITNSMFFRNDISYNNNTIDSLTNIYNCYPYYVDFSDRTIGDRISKFIKDKTHGLIDKKMLIDPNTMFMLLNTLYFKDDWKKEFEYTNEEYSFINYDSSRTNTKLISSEYISGKTYETEEFESFYSITKKSYKLKFIVPKDNYDIFDIFTEENINLVNNTKYISSELIDGITYNYHTNCLFPKFEAKSNDVSIKKILKNDFSLVKLFSINPDFSELLETNEITEANMEHDAILKVDEKGIEGAAVTTFYEATSAAPIETIKDVYKSLVVDKAFGYLLTNRTNEILFSGIINNID